jgi:DNA-binding MarR family transcriptional regulator
MDNSDCLVPGMTLAESRAWLGMVGTMQLLPPVLDAQLQRDGGLTHFEYMVLTMLQLEPGNMMRMTALASHTNATLPRLSNVCARLEQRGLLSRSGCPQDRRATNIGLTAAGAQAVSSLTDAYHTLVHEVVLDALTAGQLLALAEISEAIAAAIRDRALDRESRAPASEDRKTRDLATA